MLLLFMGLVTLPPPRNCLTQVLLGHTLCSSMKQRLRAGVRADGKTIKISISLEPEVYRTSRLIAAELGFRNSYSAYLNTLARKDVACRLDITKRP